LESNVALAVPIRYTYRRLAHSESVYEQRLVLDRPDVKVLLQESYAGPALRAAGAVIHEQGAPMVWFVFPEKWYDVGRFHLADGAFTGWYTNLTKPVEISGDRWSATDLFLDLWTPVAGASLWLDEQDLEKATRSRIIDRATRQRIDNERALIDLQLKLGAWPPQITRDIDLAQAFRLRDT
jgi:predicted RNA-binding protein associated with RNAse of E/G family